MTTATAATARKRKARPAPPPAAGSYEKKTHNCSATLPRSMSDSPGVGSLWRCQCGRLWHLSNVGAKPGEAALTFYWEPVP